MIQNLLTSTRTQMDPLSLNIFFLELLKYNQMLDLSYMSKVKGTLFCSLNHWSQKKILKVSLWENRSPRSGPQVLHPDIMVLLTPSVGELHSSIAPFAVQVQVLGILTCHGYEEGGDAAMAKFWPPIKIGKLEVGEGESYRCLWVWYRSSDYRHLQVIRERSISAVEKKSKFSRPQLFIVLLYRKDNFFLILCLAKRFQYTCKWIPEWGVFSTVN